MFRGLAAINIDVKGRMAIPTRYRDELSSLADGRLIVTIDTEQPCLLLYALPEWELIEEKLTKLSSFNPATRRIQRLLIGHATECEIDKQGRILLPALLRDYAKINRPVLLVGQGNKFEIWSESQWTDGRQSWLANGIQDDLPPELENFSL